jgi:hypothetical protein
MNWLCSQDETLRAVGISNLPGWKQRVSVKGEDLEME